MPTGPNAEGEEETLYHNMSDIGSDFTVMLEAYSRQELHTQSSHTDQQHRECDVSEPKCSKTNRTSPSPETLQKSSGTGKINFKEEFIDLTQEPEGPSLDFKSLNKLMSGEAMTHDFIDLTDFSTSDDLQDTSTPADSSNVLAPDGRSGLSIDFGSMHELMSGEFINHDFSKRKGTKDSSDSSLASDLHHQNSKSPLEATNSGGSSKGNICPSEVDSGNNQNTEMFQCEDCDKKFSVFSAYVFHMKIHTKGNPPICNICHKQFTSRKSVLKHMNSHSSWKHGPYKCRSCQEMFGEETELKAHMASEHGISHFLYTNRPSSPKSRSFTCKICQEVLSDLTDLKSHMSSKHTLRTCKECGEEFQKLSKYYQHRHKNHKKGSKTDH